MLHELEPLHANVFDLDREGFGVLPSRWYPAEVVHDLLDRLIEDRPPGELEQLAREAAYDIMSKSLKGVYGFLFSTLASPERYARHIDRVWQMHYDSGNVSITPTDNPREWRARYASWRGHHPFICKLNMAAAVPIYETMGCKHVTCTQTSCVANGADQCESLIRFSC